MKTKNNTYRTKGRALFLATLMVMSVFAVPLAFTGAVAATATSGTITIVDQPIDANGNVEVTATTNDGGGAGTGAATAVLTYENSAGEQIVAGTADASETDDDPVIIDVLALGGTPTGWTAWLFNESTVQGVSVGDVADSLAGDQLDSDTAEITIDAATQRSSVSTYYDVDRSFAANDMGDRAFWQGQEVATFALTADNDDLQLREKTGESSSSLRDELSTDVYGVATFDTETRNAGEYFLRGASAGGSLDPDTNVFEIVEQDLSVSFDDDEVTSDGSDSVTEFEIDSNRGTYSVNVSADGLDADDLFGIFNASSDFTDDDGATGSNGPFLIEADDDEDRLTVSAIRDGEYDVDFDDIDAGEYEFDFEVTDSTASASASITVVDAGDGELDFVDDSAEIEQGGIAEIVVSADNADAGTLVIGDQDDVGYQANVSILDFGDNDEITIYFNTYAAGDTTLGNVIWLDEDDEDDGAEIDFDSSSNQTTGTVDGILDTGDYELTVSAFTTAGSYDSVFERTLDEPDNVGSLFIEVRSTDAISVWTASDGSVGDVLEEDDSDQADAIAAAIEDGLITQADAVAYDDYSVHQLEISGFDGLLEYGNDQLGGEATPAEQLLNLTQLPTGDDGDSAVQLRIRETRSSVGPNAQRREANLSASDITVIPDTDNDQYFILIDTDAIEFENGGDSLDEETDYEFDVRFELRDERLLDPDDEDDLEDLYQRVETVFEVVEREGSLDVNDEDLIEVEAASGQEVTGETNIAPGSEVAIRIRGTGGARFSKSISELVVQTDGTFAGTFDFSDRNVDDEFTATLRNSGVPGDSPQEDGIVVESTAEEAADDDEEPADDDGEPVDDGEPADDGEEPADDSEEPADDTDDETPGFGALVALVALFGAALLAARRQN